MPSAAIDRDTYERIEFDDYKAAFEADLRKNSLRSRTRSIWSVTGHDLSPRSFHAVSSRVSQVRLATLIDGVEAGPKPE
jgi:hypothetical protein